ncbi:MAG: DUF4214 domain-containing protein [Planctomycetota bacterium]|nr:MAG: DUF4214 domain-containing protein [Planctomycetota bacterium]
MFSKNEPGSHFFRAARHRRAQHRALVEPLEARTVLSASMPAAADVIAIEEDGFNNPPAGSDAQVLLAPGETYTFSTSDFGFSDTDDALPDELAAVRISSLPDSGRLTFDGFSVAQFDVIPADQITLGRLQFTATSPPDVTASTSFTFQVQDDGGVAGGGSDLDPTPNRFSLLVDDESADFVRNLYEDILDREAEQEGLLVWLNLLNNGGTRGDVVRGLWQSREHRGMQVDSYYQTFLDRAPDPAGRQTWIAILRNGATEEEVMQAFLTTNEYLANNPPITEYVLEVYRDVLGREADAGGQAFWETSLDSGLLTLEEVANGLLNVRERHVNVVQTFYNDFLERNPDSQGLFTWTSLLDDGALSEGEVAQRLLSTPEYFNQS